MRVYLLPNELNSREENMETIQEQLKGSVKALIGLQPSELTTELGRRLEMTREEVEKGHELLVASSIVIPQDSSQLAGAPVWLKQLGENFLKKLNHQFYSLFCNKDDPDYSKIDIVLGDGIEKIALVLAGILVSSVGLLPGIATAVAVIIATRVIKSGREALCSTWKDTV
jgi:hypothetical protein